MIRGMDGKRGLGRSGGEEGNLFTVKGHSRRKVDLRGSRRRKE